MCKIIKIRYVTPSGRRRTSEKAELCNRSDGRTPCAYAQTSEVTELVSSGPPSLVGDEVSTPASASIPGTPLTATANYEYREPHDSAHGSSSKGKSKGKFGLYLDLSAKGKKSPSPTSPLGRHRSERGSKSGSSNGDDDSFIGIEEDGRFSSISPRSPRFSLGPPLSMRRARDTQPPVVSQPQPPMRRSSTPAPPSLHRRNWTDPNATVRFSTSADTELQDRADAREALRRENRERARRDEEERRKQQEADDRKLAEALEAKEARERAEDEYSTREYERLQEKDRLRREKRSSPVTDLEDSPSSTTADIETLEAEIRKMKLEEERLKRARDDEKAREDALRTEKRIREQDAKIEYRLREELARINRQVNVSNSLQRMQVDADIARLEAELAKVQQNRQARERAERLQQEIKHEDLLAEEIRELEDEIDREQHLRRIERMMSDRQAQQYDRQRYLPMAPMPPLPLPPPPQQVIHQRGNMSPYEDAEYRRVRGEQVLADERARAATGGLQRAIAGPGVGRRTSGSGRERDRDQVYRDLRRDYPS